MATEQLYSTAITSMRAGGGSKAAKTLHGSPMKETVATFEAGVFDAGSIYRIARLSSTAIILRIAIKGDTALVGGPVDLGLYPVNSSTALDADVYATDIDVATAAITTTETNQRFEVLDINTIEQRVWQQAGLTVEPERGTLYDLCMTTSTAISTGGTISFAVEYVDGD